MHHRDLDANNNDQTNIIPLCRKCHTLIHQIIILKPHALRVKSYLNNSTYVITSEINNPTNTANPNKKLSINTIINKVINNIRNKVIK